MAFEACCRLHPEPYRTYVVERNINYSNICVSFCLFCNFRVKADAPGAYILDFDQIGRKIQELVDAGGTQILLQGGLVPIEILPLQWYFDLLRFIKRNWPKLHVHAFSPPEIWHLHRSAAVPLKDLLLQLAEAGLDSIPGGGAEILVDRVRRRISRNKCTAGQWLEVMRTAHRIGMRTTCTMMFGHLETVAERLEHLTKLRDLQDETGGFTAFTLWPFQHTNTVLARLPTVQPVGEGRPDGRHLALAGACEYLRMLAISRLFLDNIPNIQASWVTMGPKVGQLSLLFGANDMGSTMMEENVVSAAGTTYRMTEADIRRVIADAGWEPKKRNFYYQIIE